MYIKLINISCKQCENDILYYPYFLLDLLQQYNSIYLKLLS